MRTYLRVCVVVAGLLGLGFLLPVGLGQQPKPDDKTPPAKTPPKPQLAVKVFKLERTEPETVIETLNNLLESPDMEIAPPMPTPGGPMAPGGLGALGQAGNPVGAIGFGSPLPQGGVGIGGALGQIGSFGGMIGFGGVGGTSAPVWRATVDDRTKAVIVRGSTRHLQVAADLVAVLDRRPNAPLPKLQVVKAFALKHANAEELMNVVQQLAFDDVRLSSPDEHLLVAVGPDDDTKAIAELVKELDVPAKQEPEPKKEKAPAPRKEKAPEPKKAQEKKNG